MKTLFELWDYETSNLLEAYETEQAALQMVRDTLHTEGCAAVATWALLRDDRKSPAKTVIATGADLATYAVEAQLKPV